MRFALVLLACASCAPLAASALFPDDDEWLTWSRVITETAWIRPGKVPKDAECAPLDGRVRFLEFVGYVSCRDELKAGVGTSIQLSRTKEGTGYDSFARWKVLISFQASQLRTGKWTLPAPGVQLVYSNCEQSWAHHGCYVSARASGTLELRDVSDASATVLLDAIFVPDRWGNDLDYPEPWVPKPQRFAITVVARP